jgi:hypothetical protein
VSRRLLQTRRPTLPAEIVITYSEIRSSLLLSDVAPNPLMPYFNDYYSSIPVLIIITRYDFLILGIDLYYSLTVDRQIFQDCLALKNQIGL